MDVATEKGVKRKREEEKPKCLIVPSLGALAGRVVREEGLCFTTAKKLGILPDDPSLRDAIGRAWYERTLSVVADKSKHLLRMFLPDSRMNHRFRDESMHYYSNCFAALVTRGVYSIENGVEVCAYQCGETELHCSCHKDHWSEHHGTFDVGLTFDGQIGIRVG